jgi:hypothetical protein
MSNERDEVAATPISDDSRRFLGVRANPRGGWDARIHTRGGNTERLSANAGLEPSGVFGFAVDAAIARNYFIAYWDDPYTDRHDKLNAIPEGEGLIGLIAEHWGCASTPFWFCSAFTPYQTYKTYQTYQIL